MAKMNVSLNTTKDYGNFRLYGPKKQTQTKPIFDYPCVFEWLLYNLVLRDGNGRNFNGEYLKWQMHRKPMQ